MKTAGLVIFGLAFSVVNAQLGGGLDGSPTAENYSGVILPYGFGECEAAVIADISTNAGIVGANMELVEPDPVTLPALTDLLSDEMGIVNPADPSDYLGAAQALAGQV